MEKNIYNKFDEQFRRLQPQLHWLPWVGKNYAKIASGEKILIIGESHYIPDNEDPEEYIDILWTRKFICKEGLKLLPYYIGTPTNNLIRNTEKAIFNLYDISFSNKEKLWTSCAFLNLIQRPLQSRKDRPNNDDYIDGWTTVLKVVEILRPNNCLILGKSGFGQFCHFLNNGQNDYKVAGIEKVRVGRGVGNILILSKYDINIKIIFIRHPSSFFSWKEWAKFLNNHLIDSINWIK